MQLLAKTRSGEMTSIVVPDANGGDAGTEGRVYFSSDKTMCVKLFHDTSDSPDKIAKLNYMLSESFDALRTFSKNGSTVCFPTHTAHRQRSTSAVGYVMPAATDSVSLDALFADTNPASKAASFVDRVFIAGVLSLLVLQIHRTGAIIGDLNPANIRLRKVSTAERWTLHIIDTDSFQIKVGQKVMTSDIGKDEYSSPRLINLRLAKLKNDSSARNFGWMGLERLKADDEYALAVIIFRILLSAHPMQAKPGKGSTTDNIVGGVFPYGNARESLRKRAPKERYDGLTNELKTMFLDTFTSKRSYAAKDWVIACSNLEKGLTTDQITSTDKAKPATPSFDPLGLWQFENMNVGEAKPATGPKQSVTRAPGGQTKVTQAPVPENRNVLGSKSSQKPQTPPVKTDVFAGVKELVGNVSKALVVVFVGYIILALLFGG